MRQAEAFLTEEELDSGIVISRGNQIRFWHLTFTPSGTSISFSVDAKGRGGERDRPAAPLLYWPAFVEYC